MKSDQYANVTSHILGALQRDPNVLGMIALGSTAMTSRRDQWSDHDVWVITRPGREDYYLDSDAWLPEPHNIILSARHGAHYQTALYSSGHKIDIGVFEPATAHQGKLGDYKVLLDRGGVSVLAESVKTETRRVRREELQRPGSLANVAILAWTCHQRVQRGEWLAGQKFLSAAVDLTLDLLSSRAPQNDSGADLLDPRRRLEKRAPELADEMRNILSAGDSMACAALLYLADRELRQAMPDSDWSAVDTVARWIDRPA